MDNFFTCFTLITIGSATALLIAILVLYFHNRSIIKEKDRVIYRRLQEQDSLTRELEQVQMEKDVIEQTLDVGAYHSGDRWGCGRSGVLENYNYKLTSMVWFFISIVNVVFSKKSNPNRPS